jgi:hypothetical protein
MGIQAAAAGQATKGEDGKWKVDTGYINHRTAVVDNLQGRKGAEGGPLPLTSPAVSGPSSTVKKVGDGKWSVDTSYIGYRTLDTSNLTKKEEEIREEQYADPAEKKYPYEELKGQRPSDVNPAVKELYLADAEFQTVMGCSPAEFGKMPKWKQQNLKKAKDIF